MGGIQYGARDKTSKYGQRWLQHVMIVGVFLGITIFIKTNFEVRANITGPEGWTFYSTTQHYYKVVTDCTGWHHCEQKAESEGAHLVTINDASEQDWLVATFGSDLHYGIGYTDHDSEANWVWISGESASYTNWNEGEPNNTDGNEHYAVMNWEYSGKWNDVAEGEVYWGIIERDISFGWIYNPTTSHYYKVATGCSGWHACEAMAENEAAHLVTVNDSNEQDWLVTTFSGNILYWIGFHDENHEAQWDWISGESVTYTNWSPDEPSNSYDEEHYALMNWVNPGKWNDVAEDYDAAGIIERNDAPVKVFLPIILR